MANNDATSLPPRRPDRTEMRELRTAKEWPVADDRSPCKCHSHREDPRPQHFHLSWPVSGLTNQRYPKCARFPEWKRLLIQLSPSHLPMHQHSGIERRFIAIRQCLSPLRGQHTFAEPYRHRVSFNCIHEYVCGHPPIIVAAGICGKVGMKSNHPTGSLRQKRSYGGFAPHNVPSPPTASRAGSPAAGVSCPHGTPPPPPCWAVSSSSPKLAHS